MNKKHRHLKNEHGTWANVGSHLFWLEDKEYRIKPREFEEGRFYPVVFKTDGRRSALQFSEGGFVFDRITLNECSFSWIGEALDIDWPESE